MGQIQLRGVSVGVHKEQARGKGCGTCHKAKAEVKRKVFDLKKTVQTLSPASHVFKDELCSLLGLKSSSSLA